MIDEDLLATRVRAALHGVEVPDGGPRRVLAARDLLTARAPVVGPPGPEHEGQGWEVGDHPSQDPGPEKPTPAPAEITGRPVPHRAGWVLGSAAAVVVLIIVSVVVIGGHRAGTTATKTSGSFARPTIVSGPTASGTAAANSGLPGLAEGSTSLGAPAAGPAPPQSSSAVPAISSPAKVDQTGSLTLTVAGGHLDATVAALGNRATGSGGRVEKSQTVDAAAGTYADVTLKVPSGSFANLLGAVRSLGTATAVNTSATDVTASYVDLTARLNALEATRNQFLEILAKAQSIGDILAVQAQITPLQTQIEQLQGQRQVLDDQASFATLAVHVAGPATSSVPQHARGGLSEAWAHARHAFAGGIESIVAALGGIAVFLLCVAFLAAVARVTWAVLRRRLV